MKGWHVFFLYLAANWAGIAPGTSSGGKKKENQWVLFYACDLINQIIDDGKQSERVSADGVFMRRQRRIFVVKCIAGSRKGLWVVQWL